MIIPKNPLNILPSYIRWVEGRGVVIRTGDYYFQIVYYDSIGYVRLRVECIACWVEGLGA